MKITIESPSTFNSPNLTIPINKIRTMVASRSETISEVLSGLIGGPLGAAVSRIVTDRISSMNGPMPGNLDIKLTAETGGFPIEFNLRIEGDRK